MEVSIRISKVKKLIGKRMTMSFSENKTGELWKGFMTGRKEIKNNVGTVLYSLQLYAPQFFSNFNPNTEFEKWAAIEVSDFESVPDQMETFVLEGGLYAVFIYHGAANDAADTFTYILGEWIHDSDYDLDNRPHFEILGGKYKNESPDSEEELWIPVKPKAIACSIVPWLTVRNSKKAIDFYKSAFGAVEVYRLEGDAGDLVARLSVSGAEFWISNGSDEDANPEALGGGTVRMILTCP
jgi:AraC family transcriptional regulator